MTYNSVATKTSTWPSAREEAPAAPPHPTPQKTPESSSAKSYDSRTREEYLQATRSSAQTVPVAISTAFPPPALLPELDAKKYSQWGYETRSRAASTRTHCPPATSSTMWETLLGKRSTRSFRLR